MKTAVSIPDEVFREADELADRLGWTRSKLYATALQGFLAAEGEDPVTIALDGLADELTAGKSPSPGRAMIDAGLWEW